MLPDRNRLVKKTDFQRIYKQGATISGRNIIVRIVSNKLTNSRFGIVASHKLAKKAIVRNRIKRRIREIIRLNLAKIIKGKDIIIIPKKSILLAKFSQINNEIIDILNRENAKISKKNNITSN